MWVVLLALASVATAADETPAVSGTKADRGPTIDIIEIIDRVAKRSGKQFILDPRVHGPVLLTGLDLQRVDYPQLLGILRMNEFATWESGGAVHVSYDANSRQFPIPVTTSVSPKTPDDEYVTVLVHAKYVCAAQTVPILRPLMPQAAHLAAMAQTNSMLISDHADNARRILDLIDRLDKQAAALKQNCTEPSVKSSN
jgi:general secretion pathway protein D